ncbi:TonB-dependent receptor [Aurantiacibacter gangjinensis]|uniref:TonB-dependent receptor n=1 Tax=Aurantiacibacter gangjinensis TaxID=502682 RepID=A0A0G9MRP7_9SPHN|nr:TonB-dependent receptor [Aurantiacibacter gangjinensis]APE26965.1 TonB-dependent receptor [Aurantiacibacter gangjinensis]KLE33416.1 TonB-dependent receptor [Aurantiacibacter gangjinensis]
MKSMTAGNAGFSRKFLCGVAAIAMVAPTAAYAQDEAETGQDVYPEEGGEDNAQGNDIIVTATKREATLQEIPVAVSVTGAETLERDQIRDIRDLSSVVPSLTVGQRQSSANTGFFIRGFGNGANNAGIEPSVGVFIDGVYRSRTASSISDLPNVQRIEVLRGPQSTLFGKNASAGVISVTTEEPQFDWGGSAELTYGNYDAMIARGYITGPLADTVAISIGAGVNHRDGFFEDLETGVDVSDRDRWYARGQLLIDNGTDLSLRIIGDYERIDEVCCGVVNVLSGPATAAVIGVGGQVTDPNDRFADVVYNNFPSTNEIRNYGVSGQLDYDIGDWTLTSITASRSTEAVTFQDSDFSSADLIFPNSADLEIDTFTQEFRVAGSIADRVDLLVGVFYINEDVETDNQLLYGADFRNYADLLIQSGTGGAFDLLTLEQVFSQSFGNNIVGQSFVQGAGFTENFTLDSEAFSIFGQVDFEIVDGLVLTLGGNYTDDSKEFSQTAVSTDVFSAVDFDAPQLSPFRNQVLFRGAVAQTVGDALMLGRPATQAEVTAFAGANPAAFGQISAGAQAFANANANNPLANPLNPLRALQFLPPFLNVPNAVEDGVTNDDNFSYTARLAYDVTPDVNVYLSYATGFKASSINLSRDARPAPGDRAAIIAAGLDLPNLTFGSRFAGPEESTVYEAGIKANFDTFSANLTVFEQEIEGFQSNIFTGSGFVLANAGSQSTFGVEFESTFFPTPALVINAAVTYLDPQFDSFVQSAQGDISGTRPSGIPEWTMIIGAQYEADLGNALLVPRVNYLRTSEFQLVEGLPSFAVRGPDGTIVDGQPAINAGLPFTAQQSDLTASLTYEHENGLSLSIWGRNLLDNRELGTVFDSPAQPGSVSGYPNDPRTYGVTGRYRF